MMKFLPCFFLSLLLSLTPTHAQQVEEIDLEASDVAGMLNASVWAFNYKPENPSRSLHLLVSEELTDDKGKTTTTIRKAMWMGMLPDPARVFKIKMLLIDRELRSQISAAGGPPIKLSEHFVGGNYEYRRGRPHKPDAQGWRFLTEIGNKNPYKGKPPFKLVLKFKVFENHSNGAIQAIINGEKDA